MTQIRKDMGEAAMLHHIHRFFICAVACVISAYIFSYITSESPWLRFMGISVGSLMFLGCLAAIYFNAGFCLRPDGLKILDWLLIGFDLSMVACFNWIGAAPLYWLLFVLVPSLGARIAVGWYIKNMPKHGVAWTTEAAKAENRGH